MPTVSPSPQALANTPQTPRRLALWLAGSLFLAVFGAKLMVVDRFGTDLPYWDQWAVEGTDTFLPWFNSHDSWSPLLRAHNEHRIAPTRLLCLGLLGLGGQWDTRVQCTVNAGIHAALVGFFFWWLQRRVSAGWAVGAAAFLAAVFMPPIPWEDVLGGFQSQFYFLILFSVVGIGGVLSAGPFSLRWCAGVGFCFVAIVTMGSGFLCGVPLVMVAGLRLLRRVGARRDALWTLAAGLLVVIAGACAYVPVPYHEPLRAHSAGQFLGYIARCLSWPWPQWPWLWIVFWTPWCIFLVWWLRAFRSGTDRSGDFVIAAGLWVLFQTAALSYSRGGGSVLPSPRYGDITGLGVPLGFAAVAILGGHRRFPGRLIAAVYAVIGLTALGVATHATWTGALPRKKGETEEYERNVRAFVLTGDFSHLKDKRIPFPSPEWLRDILMIPRLRDLLPASVRAPLRLPGFPDTEPEGLPFRPVRRVERGTHWESGPLPSGPGWWKIETFGDLGRPGASLAIVAPSERRVMGHVAPTKAAGQSWRAAYVRAPREPAVFVAETDANSSFAFSEPVAISWLSYGLWQLGKQGRWLALAGLAGICLAAGVEALAPRSER